MSDPAPLRSQAAAMAERDPLRQEEGAAMAEGRGMEVPGSMTYDGGEGEVPCAVSPVLSPGSWPRSFEHSMDLYSNSRSYKARRASRDSFTSEDFLPPGDLEEPEPSLRPWVKRGRGALVSALTPLLSESNLVQLEENASRMNAPDFDESDCSAAAGSNAVHKIRRVLSNGSDESQVGVYETLEFQPGASFSETAFNSVNVLMGVGILSTPYATGQSGWLGLAFFFLFAFLFFSTGIFLKDCLESRPNIITYPDIGETAFGRTGRWITAILLYVELYSVTVDLMILEGDNLARLFPSATLDLSWVVLPPDQAMLIITVIFVLPTVLLRDLSFLAYLSACGVVATVLVVLAVGWIGVGEGVGFHEKGTLFRWNGLPVAIGMYSFCFSGHTVLPNIYCSMKDPSRFSQVLAISFGVSTVLYGAIAVMGYSMYGDNIQSQVTLNLPPESLISKVAIWTTVVNPLTKFALMITPLAIAIEELFPSGLRKEVTQILGAVVRILLVISAVFVALVVPFFGFVMALIGSFLGITMSVILPCACYLRLVEGKRSRSKQVAAVLFIVFGVISATIGTYASVSSIWNNIAGPDPSA